MQIFHRIIIINVVVDVVCKITIFSSLWSNFMNNPQNLRCFRARNTRHRLAVQCAIHQCSEERAPALLACLPILFKNNQGGGHENFSIEWYFLIYALLVCFIKYLLQEVSRSNFGCDSFRSILFVRSVHTSVVNLLQIILRMVSSSRRLRDVKHFVRIEKLSAYEKNWIHFFVVAPHNCTHRTIQSLYYAQLLTTTTIWKRWKCQILFNISCLTAAYIVPEQKMLRIPAREESIQNWFSSDESKHQSSNPLDRRLWPSTQFMKTAGHRCSWPVWKSEKCSACILSLTLRLGQKVDKSKMNWKGKYQKCGKANFATNLVLDAIFWLFQFIYR